MSTVVLKGWFHVEASLCSNEASLVDSGSSLLIFLVALCITLQLLQALSTQPTAALSTGTSAECLVSAPSPDMHQQMHAPDLGVQGGYQDLCAGLSFFCLPHITCGAVLQISEAPPFVPDYALLSEEGHRVREHFFFHNSLPRAQVPYQFFRYTNSIL